MVEVLAHCRAAQSLKKFPEKGKISPTTPWPWAVEFERRHPLFVLMNSILLAVVFFLCRVILFPGLLIHHLYEIYRMWKVNSGGADACLADPEACALLVRYNAEISWTEVGQIWMHHK